VRPFEIRVRRSLRGSLVFISLLSYQEAFRTPGM
jgi:hypothetical protein